MAITTIQGTDLPSDSRIVINDNFSDLDTTKADLASPTFTGTPTLPTGTVAVTQTAGYNSTKLATTAYADIAAATVTQATATTVFPQAMTLTGLSATTINMNSSTTAFVAMVTIPYKITVNKISNYFSTVTGTGTVDLSLYSEDGQTQLFSVTTASVVSATVYTTAVSAVEVPAGNYYIMVNPNGAFTACQMYSWATGVPFQATSSLNDITSEPIISGTITIASGTPATFNPTADITGGVFTPIVRLDN